MKKGKIEARQIAGYQRLFDRHVRTAVVELPDGSKVAVRRTSDGANRMNALDRPGASLWPLIPGTNDVQLQMIDAGPGASTVVEFRRRYEGP